MNFDRILESECDRITTTTTTTSATTTPAATTVATTTAATTTSATTTSATTTAAPTTTTTTTTPEPSALISLTVARSYGTFEGSCAQSTWFGQLVNSGSASFGTRTFDEVKNDPLVIYWNTQARDTAGLPCFFISTTLGDEMTDSEILACWPGFTVTLHGDGTATFGC